MQDGFVKVLLVVVVVLGLSAAGVCVMAVSDSQAPHENVAAAAHRHESPPAPEAPPAAEQEADDAEVVETAPEQPSEQEVSVKQAANPEAAPVESFDPLLGEHFDEAALSQRSPVVLVPGANPEDAEKSRDIQKLDAQAEKMAARLSKKVNVISSKMRLDDRARADLAEISLEGLSQVVEIRKQFAGQEMTDADRAYVKEQVRAANIDTTGRIRSLLGEEKFKQFRKESRYYDNPNARVLDQMKNIEKQNRNLQKKIDEQSRQLKSSRPGSRKRSRPWRPRGR